jgi:predicted amidohydrolase
VVVFPELSLTGYELEAPSVSPGDGALSPLVQACAATGSIALVGAPICDSRGRHQIATLHVSGAGVDIAYRKSHLGGDESVRFSPGDGPTALEVDGWRLGIGICKDTGVAEHIEGTAALGVDLYVAGLVHLPGELPTQDERAIAIARACGSYVAFASFAGPTGGGYERTAGSSAIWSPDGTLLARAGEQAGEVARAAIG